MQISYSQIQNTQPDYPCGEKPKRELKAWHVTLFFAAMMVLFLTVGSLIQFVLGLWGVLITEIGFAVLSLLFVKIMHADVRKVFPFAMPRPAGLGGVIVFWIGCYLSLDIISMIQLMIMPDKLMEMNESLETVMGDLPAVIAFLIISVSPAICEEMMHRGVIQNGLRNSISGKWGTVLLTGVFFGFFHLYPVRFPSTAFLGGALAYLLMTTDNMAYSCFFHLFHNGVVYLLSMAVPDVSAVQEATVSVSQLGFFTMFYGLPIPILLYTGIWLIKKAQSPAPVPFLPSGKEKATLIRLGLASAGFLIAGLYILLGTVV